MTLPRYRLQPVLDSKEKKKKDAEKKLADTRKELLKQEGILQQREEEVQKAIRKKDDYTRELMMKMDQGMENAKITAGKTYIEVLKKNIVVAQKRVEEQKQVVKLWQAKVDAAVKELTEATKEMKVIEKHKENWAEQLKKEIEAKEEKEQEEVAQNLYEQHRRQRSS